MCEITRTKEVVNIHVSLVTTTFTHFVFVAVNFWTFAAIVNIFMPPLCCIKQINAHCGVRQEQFVSCVCRVAGFGSGAGYHQPEASAGETHRHNGSWEDAMVPWQDRPRGLRAAAAQELTRQRQIPVSLIPSLGLLCKSKINETWSWVLRITLLEIKVLHDALEEPFFV